MQLGVEELFSSNKYYEFFSLWFSLQLYSSHIVIWCWLKNCSSGYFFLYISSQFPTFLLLYTVIPGLPPSTAGCSPSYHISSRLAVRHLGTISSRHLFICLPRDLLPYLGCQSVILFVHLLSLSLATWPAHFHFCLAANLTTPLIFVFALISQHGILSFNFDFNILLSITLCAILSLWVVALVNDHVWDL